MAQVAMLQIDDEEDDKKLVQKYQGIVNRLEDKARRRVDRRREIEDRWLRDAEQYHGEYDPETKRKFVNSVRSQVFINRTRPKTNKLVDRLTDILFPVDEKNWAIEPTPVPEITRAARDALKQRLAAMSQAQAAQGQADSEDPASVAAADQAASNYAETATVHATLVNVQDEARRRADVMELEIDDQLTACDYGAQSRLAIEDGFKFGIGVLKGPVTGEKLRRGWKAAENREEVIRSEEGQGQGQGPEVLNGAPPLEFSYETRQDDHPVIRRVDIWQFFPDPDFRNPAEGSGVFERHICSKQKLRQMAKWPGMDRAAIRRIISGKPREPLPSYMAELQEATNQQRATLEDLYVVWEYSGPIDGDDLRAIYQYRGDGDGIRETEDIDVLDEINVVIWFCDKEILRVGPHPLDSGECLYSTFVPHPDEASPWGFGIPYLTREPQRVYNAAWRALMDNAGVGAGVQLFINQTGLEPQNGRWEVEPWKIWYLNRTVGANDMPFAQFQIDMRVEELSKIIELAEAQMDEVTGTTEIDESAPGTGIQSTATGAALVVSSQNVVYRGYARAWDDGVTVPTIRRAYDWNMQHGQNPDAKGDFSVRARGSNVLVARELAAQNLAFIALTLKQNPSLGAYLKDAPLVRRIVQSLMLPAGEIVLSDDELAQQGGIQDPQAAALQQQADVAQAEMEYKQGELEARVSIANMETQTRLKVAQLQKEIALIQAAQKSNDNLDKLDAQEAMKAREIEQKDRGIAVEAAVAEKTKIHSGGAL